MIKKEKKKTREIRVNETQSKKEKTPKWSDKRKIEKSMNPKASSLIKLIKLIELINL